MQQEFTITSATVGIKWSQRPEVSTRQPSSKSFLPCRHQSVKEENFLSSSQYITMRILHTSLSERESSVYFLSSGIRSVWAALSHSIGSKWYDYPAVIGQCYVKRERSCNSIMSWVTSIPQRRGGSGHLRSFGGYPALSMENKGAFVEIKLGKLIKC